jgi:hypothetical protein
LKKVFGEESVVFWNDDSERIARGNVILCSSMDYREYFAAVPQAQIYLNQDSLPERPAAVAREYLSWICSIRGAMFFSYQRENGVAVNGIAQNNIHALIEQISSARLLTRNLSWTRDGYTEETYVVN